VTVKLPEENPGITFGASITDSTLDTDPSNNAATMTTKVVDAPLIGHGRTVLPSSNNKKNFDNVTVGTFTDANLSAPASDFTATINWGDGTITTSQVVANESGTFSIVGSHDYQDRKFKSYALVIQVVDQGGSVTTINSTAVLG